MVTCTRCSSPWQTTPFPHLARAARAIGGAERLAEYLDVPEAELREWFDGTREPPTSIYVRALDLVARGPFGAPRPGKSHKEKY